MLWAYGILVAICVALTVLGTCSAVWLLRVRAPVELPDGACWPRVSVLKPLKGVDEKLADNLESFAALEYPDFELLFGVEGEDDPAVGLVRDFMAGHPELECRLVVHRGDLGLHPKIANIRAMLDAGAEDLIAIVDSNVSVSPDYLRHMVSRKMQPGVGLVTSIYVGTEERQFPAFLENMQINGPILNHVAMYRIFFQETLVLGKSTLLSQGEFAALGGFQSLSYVLAEDYLMGKMIKRGGYAMDFSVQSVANVNPTASLSSVWMRHLRWAITRSHVAPFLYPFELCVSPLFVALVAPLFGISWGLSLLGMWALIGLRDGLQWWLTRGSRRLLWVLLLSPLREAFFFSLWVVAPFFRSVRWRGQRLHIGEGTHLFVKEQRSQ